MRPGLVAALCLVALLAIFPPVAKGADEAATEVDSGVGSGMKEAFSDQPITINSDRLEADDVARKVRFVGNVVAQQGDIVLYAAEMVVRYRPESREIDRIEAYRDVRIVQGVKVATGEKGVFFREEGRIVLTGSPKVHHGKDFVEGDEITVLLNEDRSIVSSEGGSRVNAVFHPKESSP